MSYNEVHSVSTQFGKGLQLLGQKARTPIAIYAETRAEWIMSAFGAFSQSIYVATLYTNLGDDAIVHGINETEVREVAIWERYVKLNLNLVGRVQ
jgi:long-chain acyl-CoA synthetase